MDPRVATLIAGLCWGTWPLLMNRSGLTGNVSGAVFAGVAFLLVLPFALREGGLTITTSAVVFALAAGILGGLGLLAFNGMLANVTPAQVGRMFLIMIMVQIAVPAIYQMVMSGSVEARQLAGIGTAALAAYLLS